MPKCRPLPCSPALSLCLAHLAAAGPSAAWPWAAPAAELLGEGAGEGAQTNKSERLKAEIAWLHQELHNESLRIAEAEAATAEANATLQEEEQEVASTREQLAAAKARARKAREDAADAKARLRELERSDKEQVGPVGVWLTELPHQQTIAIVVGIMGLLSVLGPSTYTRAFLAITGSAVGGLMVGGCFSFFFSGQSWLNSVRHLLDGTGGLVGYLAWAIMLSLGIVRWLVGFNCALYACVDEVEIDGSGRMISAGGSLQKPLLGDETSSGRRNGAQTSSA